MILELFLKKLLNKNSNKGIENSVNETEKELHGKPVKSQRKFEFQN